MSSLRIYVLRSVLRLASLIANQPIGGTNSTTEPLNHRMCEKQNIRPSVLASTIPLTMSSPKLHDPRRRGIDISRTLETQTPRRKLVLSDDRCNSRSEGYGYPLFPLCGVQQGMEVYRYQDALPLLHWGGAPHHSFRSLTSVLPSDRH
jgi:hypothetical protein